MIQGWPPDPRDPAVRPRLEESLALWREMGNEWGEWGTAEALLYLSGLVAAQGEPSLARAYLDEALAVARPTGDRRHLGWVRAQLGHMAFAAGELDDAHRLGEESRAFYQELGYLHGVSGQENFLGNVAFSRGEYATAQAHYAAALRCQQGWQGVLEIVGSCSGLAAVALAQGHAARALHLAAAIAALSAQAGYGLDTVWAHVPVEQTIAAARAALDERTAAETWAEGETMTLEQAIAYALGEPAHA
jgi:non-specific serine/threonine protein kinase